MDVGTEHRPLRWWDVRPVEIPDDVDDPGLAKASGRVRLPHHVRWSSPRREYDLDDPADRNSAYCQVMVEGTADDVRFFVDVDQVVAMWDELFLPPPVRRAWAAWLKEHRGLELSC